MRSPAEKVGHTVERARRQRPLCRIIDLGLSAGFDAKTYVVPTKRGGGGGLGQAPVPGALGNDRD